MNDNLLRQNGYDPYRGVGEDFGKFRGKFGEGLAGFGKGSGKIWDGVGFGCGVHYCGVHY